MWQIGRDVERIRTPRPSSQWFGRRGSPSSSVSSLSIPALPNGNTRGGILAGSPITPLPRYTTRSSRRVVTDTSLPRLVAQPVNTTRSASDTLPSQRQKTSHKRSSQSSVTRLSSIVSRNSWFKESMRDCVVCTDSHGPSGFPSHRITRTCNHEPSTCRACVRTSISMEIKSNFSGQVHCPECRAVLEHNDVKTFADKATFAR
jgi:hypothetical protein